MDFLKWLKGVNIYDFTIAALAVIAAVGIFYGNTDALAPLVAATLAAAVLDYAIGYLVHKKGHHIPKTSIITGMIVGMVMAPSGIPAAVGVAAIAMLAKHLLAFSRRPLFNPAAFALVFSVLIFSYSDSWWAAGFSPAQPLTALVVLLALAAAWKLNRLPLAFSFLVAEAIIADAYSGFGSLASVQGLTSVLGFSFFAGFMLDEPRTSAITRNAQVAEGLLVAALALAIARLLPPLGGATDLLLLSLLVANLAAPLLNKYLKMSSAMKNNE